MREGTTVTPPRLVGRWSVWSKAADCPGAHFIVPADDVARASGIKHAVIRVTQKSNEAYPEIELIRTDPTIEGLIP